MAKLGDLLSLIFNLLVQFHDLFCWVEFYVLKTDRSRLIDLSTRAKQPGRVNPLTCQVCFIEPEILKIPILPRFSKTSSGSVLCDVQNPTLEVAIASPFSRWHVQIVPRSLQKEVDTLKDRPEVSRSRIQSSTSMSDPNSFFMICSVGLR